MIIEKQMIEVVLEKVPRLHYLNEKYSMIDLDWFLKPFNDILLKYQDEYSNLRLRIYQNHCEVVGDRLETADEYNRRIKILNDFKLKNENYCNEYDEYLKQQEYQQYLKLKQKFES